MYSIKILLEKNPDLLRIETLDPHRKERRDRYAQTINADYDKLHELAKEYIRWGQGIPSWKVEASCERILHFGKNMAKEYAVSLIEIETFFNEVLPRYMRGGLLGCFISGLYRDIIKEHDILTLNLKKYPATVSGVGYRHPKGRLEVIGHRAYYLGVEMEQGQIFVTGSAGNYLGRANRGGHIIVEGDARNWVGEKMKAGSILIKGDVGHIIGKKMAGGEIVIEGSAGYWVGDDMRGGIIKIKGEYQSLGSERKGGEIYHWKDKWERIM